MNPPLLRLSAPSRLHFGLLAWGKEAPRQFGSIGLMVERPGLTVVARPSETWAASGPLAARALAMIQKVLTQLSAEGTELSPLHLTVETAPAEHVGLGTGTQISLVVARLLLHRGGEPNPSIARLASLTGRGLRSGIGLHGFARGGLLVDGGRSDESVYPPLLTRISLPTEWSVLVVVPTFGAGLSDDREREAFAHLPDPTSQTIDRLCRLVLLGVLPAAAEGNLQRFGDALTELQFVVGQTFASAQGGIFGHPRLEAITAAMKKMGLVGVGQSSWGPTLYGFLAWDEHQQAEIARKLFVQFSLSAEALIWTRASDHGVVIQAE